MKLTPRILLVPKLCSKDRDGTAVGVTLQLGYNVAISSKMIVNPLARDGNDSADRFLVLDVRDQ